MHSSRKKGLSASAFLLLFGLLVSVGSFGLGGFAIYKDSPRSFEAEIEVPRWFRAVFRSGVDSKPKPEALPAATQSESLPATTQTKEPTGKL